MLGEESIIVTKDEKYHLYSYENEIELERMIVEHSSEIFGKNTKYFNKRKIESKSGFGTTPDGYVIDFDKKKLYIVEVELIKHDLRRHVLPQITSFFMALQNKKSQEKLVEIFEEELKSSYKVSKEELKSIVANQSTIILIDEVGDPMKEINPLLEIVNFLAIHGEVIAIPFQTYVKDNKLSPDHVHLFKSFTREELEKESKKWSFKWTTVAPEKHLKKATKDIRDVFIEFSKKVRCIAPNVKEVHRKNWITYQTSPLKNFCTVKVLKDSLEIYIKVDQNMFIDRNGITSDIKRTPTWTFDKVFTINSQKDIDYVISLIEQAYECVCDSKNQK